MITYLFHILNKILLTIISSFDILSTQQLLLVDIEKNHTAYAAIILKEVLDMYECLCGYVYDPEVGDPENDIPKGTEFEELPEDWVCPICGLDKSAFSEI